MQKITIENIENFESDRMLLKRICNADFEQIFQLHNDPEVAKTLGGTKTADEIKEFLKQYDL